MFSFLRNLARPLLLLVMMACSASAIDRGAFTVLHYDLEVRTNPEEQAVAARGKIRLRNDSSQPQKVLALQISSTLEWRMIESDGKPLEYLAEPLTSDIDHTGKLTEAIITLPVAVLPKNTVELDVGYSGTISVDATRLTRIGVPNDRALTTDWDRIGQDFTAVRGVGHVAWYPIASDVANLSDNTLFSTVARWQARQAQTDMKVRYCWITEEDHSFTVAANGVFEGIDGGTGGGEGNRTGCSSYSYHDLSQTIPTFAIAPFEMLTRPAESLYYLEGHEKAANDFALGAEKVQPWIEEWFGKVTSKIQVIELPDANAAPFDSGTMLFTPLNNKDSKQVELAMAHQLTHAAIKSSRLWISEGLAQFAQALVRERQDGRRTALDYMSARLPALVEVEKQNAEAAKPTGDAAQALAATSDEVYYRVKAMYVWWMLRDMLTDEVLQAALKNYRSEQDRDPAYIQRLIAAQSKRDLEWFFDDWVYRDKGLPQLQLVSAVPRETLNGANVVAITLENTGGVGAEVPVSVITDSGGKSVRMTVQSHQKEITRVSVPGKPKSVVVNDGSVPVSDDSKSQIDLK